jgi:DNA-3-methyladenine glycosylase
MARMVRLPREAYARHTEEVARDLLGKVLVRRDERGKEWAGRIVETEAYHGFDDRASHGFRGKTARNQIMFGPPGYAYVYQIYGLHFCLNATTGVVDVPSAVLIRALAPIEGQPFPGTRRGREPDVRAAAGPAKLCERFGIDKRQYGEDLVRGRVIWIGDDGVRYGDAEVSAGARVGVDYAGEWAAHPWRFWVKGHPSVSKLPAAERPRAGRTSA